jgi:hypothetical protein
MQTVLEWEKEHNKEYPEWAVVWHYDAYGEAWVPEQWKCIKDFYEEERKQSLSINQPMWQYYFEPLVALPDSTCPKWGTGIPLKRTIS